MPVKKNIPESIKTDIYNRWLQHAETYPVLANHFGVSKHVVSRVINDKIPKKQPEYIKP